MESIKNLFASVANDLNSRTISWAVFLGALLLFPDFHAFVSQVFNLLPEAVEGVADGWPILEVLSLVGVIHGRKNVRAKLQ